MNKNKTEAVARFGLDLKTNNFTGGETEAFSSLDYHNQLESVQSIIDRMMRTGKVIRCYRCFACNRHFTASRMATALVVCRECLQRTHGKGRLARRNQIDRITNAVRVFLRGRLEAR